MIERIDTSRLDAARAVIEYVLPKVDDIGLFRPEESLWAESGVYRAQLAGTLSVVGGLLDDGRCIDAARRILYRMLDVRLGKLWGLGLVVGPPHRSAASRRLGAPEQGPWTRATRRPPTCSTSASTTA